MSTLAEIEGLTRAFAEQRQTLADLVGDLNFRIDVLKNAALPKIKKAVQATAEKQALLAAAVDGSRELFVKPRTVIFHGIKVGIEKGKGKIEIDDEERTMKLIRRHLPDQVDLLLNTKTSVSKTAIKGLSVAELKSIGCTVEETDDQVVIRATDKEVDKVVNALLKDAVEDVERKEAA